MNDQIIFYIIGMVILFFFWRMIRKMAVKNKCSGCDLKDKCAVKKIKSKN